METVNKSRGRRKIEIKCIEKNKSRQGYFSKCRQGLFKKANELSTLFGVEVAVVVFSLSRKFYSFDQPSLNHVLGRFLDAAPIPSVMSPVLKFFWWDIEVSLMAVDGLREYKNFLLEQQAIVTQATKQSYISQATEAMMRHINNPPAVPEVKEDYFLWL